MLLVVLLVWTACNGEQAQTRTPAPDADQLDSIIQRIEALETAVATPTHIAASAATETPEPTPTPAPTATRIPTPIPTDRQDICYRSLPVQDALLDIFYGPDLCAAINLGELFRLESLNIEAEGYPLEESDFADMPNLRSLVVHADWHDLAPDVFHKLTALQHLTLELFLDADQDVPADGLNGLPAGLNSLALTIKPRSGTDGEPRLIELPADLFGPVAGIEHLRIDLYGSSGRCFQFDPMTLSGLSRLHSLDIAARNGVRPIPRELFVDLESLEAFALQGRVCTQVGEAFEQDHSEDGRHRLYFPTLEMLLKMADYCRSSSYCEAVGLIDE